jgi:ribosomal protein L16 Arg81 hydroxylase
MTASIGFRAPNRNEWLNAYLDDLSDSLEDILAPTHKRLKIPVTKNIAGKISPARIESSIPDQFGTWVDELMGKGVAEKFATKTHIRELTGRFLTEPKNHTTFVAPTKPLSEAIFAKRLIDKGVALSLASRCLYSQVPKTFFLNGESFSVSGIQLSLLAHLADTKQLGGIGANLSGMDTDLMESLYQWYTTGWITIR